MCMKKHHRKWRHTEFFKRARAIYNVHSYYSFALRVHENALVLDEQKRINFSGTLLVTKSDIKDNKVNPLWLWDEEIFQSFNFCIQGIFATLDFKDLLESEQVIIDVPARVLARSFQ